MPKSTFINLKAEKREDFLEAALAEFSLKGFHGASLTQLVKNLGIAKGSLYQYFHDKEEIYLYLLTEACSRRLSFFDVLEGKPSQDYLFNYLIISLKCDAVNPALACLMYAGLSTFNTKILDLIDNSFCRKVPQNYLGSPLANLTVAAGNFAALIKSRNLDLSAIVRRQDSIPLNSGEIVQIVQNNQSRL